MLIEALDGAPKAAADTITTAADGNGGTFVIAIDEPGEYHYRIWQKAGGDTDIVYDDTIYTGTVEVMINEDGTLSSMIVFNDDKEAGVKPDKVIFQNRPVTPPDDNPPDDNPPRRRGGGGGGNHRSGFPTNPVPSEGVLGADREPAIEPAGVLGESRLPQVAGVFRTGDSWPLILFGVMTAAGLMLMAAARTISPDESDRRNK